MAKRTSTIERCERTIYTIRPRPYLSWSALSTLESSEKGYKKIYMQGFKLHNAGMALGSKVAEAMESDEETGDLMEDFVISQIPKFEKREMELRTEIEVGGVKIPLLGKMDSAREDLTGIKEVKTGVTSWGQKKVDNFGQLTFYCTMIYSMTGRIPEDIELIYAPSERYEGMMRLTGEVRRFKTKRTLADVMKMKIRMKNAWILIGKLSAEELGI